MTGPSKPILASLSPAQIEHAKAKLDRLVDRSGGPDACWPWVGGSFNYGYGVFFTQGTAKTRRMIKGHRLAYEMAHDGECPPVVDHMCHDNAVCKDGELCIHRRCCNPGHLSGKTAGENISRANAGIYNEFCRVGHRMSGDNVYETVKGFHVCRQCKADRTKERRERAPRRTRVPLVTPRPAGVSAAELVSWALEGQDPEQCNFWPGVTPTWEGYALTKVDGKTVRLYRFVYEVRNGSIPKGFVIDHACHDPKTCEGGNSCSHRACVNPGHLKAVPTEHNTSSDRTVKYRTTDECRRGHKLTDGNFYLDPRGTRCCATCRADRVRAAQDAAKKASGWEDKRFRSGNLCRRQHDVSVTGTTPSGACAECKREREQARGMGQMLDAPTSGRRRQGDLCRNGHDVTVVGLKRDGSCAQCKLDSIRRAAAKKVAKGALTADARS